MASSTETKPRRFASGASRALGPAPGRRGRWVLLGFVLVALLAASVWALFASSWLAAQHVEVSGERTLSARQIRAAAAVDLGTSLVRLDLDSIQRRVAALPVVASVTVHRRWPQTVQIAVTERRPVAAVRDHGGWAEVDKTGVSFRQVRGKPALPVISMSAPHSSALVGATASVIAALPSDLLGRMRVLRAHSLDSIALHLKDGRVIHWGSSSDNAAKVRVVHVLLKQRAAAYDVSVPAQPTTSR